MSGTEKKQISYVLLAIWTLLPVTFMFMVVSDLPHVFIVAFILLSGSLTNRRAVKFNDRSIIYFSVLALILTTLLDYVFPMENDSFGFISFMTRPNFTVPLLLYAAILSTFFPSRPQVGALCCCAALWMLTVCGDVVVSEKTDTRLPELAFLLYHYRWFYVLVLSSTFCAIILFWRRSCAIESIWSGDRQIRRARNRKFLLQLLIIIIVPLSVVGFIKIYRTYAAYFHHFERYLMKMGNPGIRSRRYNLYQREINLKNSTFADYQDEEKMNRVIMRIKSDKEPGYLRVQSYDKYKHGKWQLGGKIIKRALISEKPKGAMLAYRIFDLKVNVRLQKTEKFYCMLSSYFAGDYLPVPGGALSFEIIANRMYYDNHGVFSVEDFVRDGGFTVAAAAGDYDNAWGLPDLTAQPEKKSDYLHVPADLRGGLQKFLGSCKIPEKADDETAAKYLRAAFLQNFKYKLGVVVPNRSDAVLYFLKTAKQGHCEYFASSAALLLRLRGIPTRYVRGFYCGGNNSYGSYYMVCIGSAHAWVEYWDRQQGNWRRFEPTPPSNIRLVSRQVGLFDSARGFMQWFFAELRRGRAASLLMSAFAVIFSFVWKLLSSVIGMTLSFLLLLYAIYRIRRWLRQRRIYAGLERERVIVQSEFIKLRRKVCRQLRIKHANSLTAEDLIFALEQSDSNVPRDDTIALLEDYQKLRYGSQLPNAEEILAFRILARRWPA